MMEYDGTLFEAVPCGIIHFSVEENPQILDFNGACAQIYGYPSKEEFSSAIDRSAQKIVYSYDTEFFNGYIRRAIQTKQTVNFGYRIQRQNHTISYIMGTIRLITLEDGASVLQSIFQDSGEHIMQADIRKSIYYQSVEASINTKKIILADSDPVIRQELCDKLKDEYTVICVENANGILSVLKKEGEEIAAVLITYDILSEQDYRFIATFRSGILYATIPLIVLAKESVSMEELLSHGVNDVVYQPYGINVLRMRLANLIELRSTAVQRNAIESLMNNLSGGVLIFKIGKDSSTHLYYTEGVVTLTGMSRQEVESLANKGSWENVVYEKDIGRLRAELQQAAAEEAPLEITFRIRQKNGNLAWIHLHGTKMKSEADGVTYQCIVSPTSASEKLYMNIMNDSFNGVIVYGENKDDLLYFNNAAVPFLKENLQNAFADGELSRDTYVQKQLLLAESRKHVTLNGKLIDWNGIRARIIYATDDTDSYRIQVERHQLYEMELSKLQAQPDNMLLSVVFNLNQDKLIEFGTDRLLDLEVDQPYTLTDCMEKLRAYAADEQQEKLFDGEFTVDAFLERYQKGNTKATMRCKVRRNDGGFQWVAISWALVENPATLELYAFFYLYDVDWEVVRQISFAKILAFEEEYVACLDLAEGSVRLMELTEESTVIDQGKMTYDQFRELFWKGRVDQKEQRQLWKLTEIPYIREQLERDPVYSYYYQKKTKDGGKRRKKVRVFYLDEKQDVLCFTRTDVTDLQEEQQRQNEQLEIALSEAEQANKAKSMFLSRMSHDIRTPMNAILGMSRLALDTTEDPQVVRDYLEKIQSSGNYLLGLINDILDMSRIESDRVYLEMEPYSIKECIDLVLVTLAMQIEEKELNFSYCETEPMPESVLLDKKRMQQIFFNLISNAVKFSHEKGNIQVVVKPGECVDGIWNTDILISDDGIGIAEEDQEKIFEAFEQGNNQGELRWQGTGLGLAIVQNLIRLMGGSISVESKLGKGTTFTLHLKLKQADPAEEKENQEDAQQKSAKEYDFTGVRVLLVEDNAINMEIAKTMLSHKNCAVDEAVNGKVALEILENSRQGYYHAIFMDMQMPVMDGLEATRQIRRHRREDLARLPIIAMTANAFAEDVRRSSEAGMNGHIVKPVDIQILYQTLESILEKTYKDKGDGSW